MICLNYRGATSSRFLLAMKEIIKLHKLQIVALLEPRVSGATTDGVRQSLGMKDWFRVEASGFSGGLWILWNSDKINLKVVHAQKKFVHLSVLPLTGRS